MADVKKMTFRHSKPGTRNKGFEIITIDKILNKDKFLTLTKPAQVNFYNMLFITEGKGSFEIDFKEFTVSKGDIIFISEEREHRFVDYKSLDGIIVMFTEDFLYEILGSKTIEVLELYKETYLNPVIEIFVEDNSILSKQLEVLKMVYDEKNIDFDFEVFALVFRTMIRIVEKKVSIINSFKDKENMVFLEFSKLLDQNLKTMKAVQEYSDLMEVSKKVINTATQKAVNMSAKQYIIYKLIQKIKINLCFEEKNIDEIACEFQFTEAYNLTKFFKKYTGITPTTFKKQNR